MTAGSVGRIFGALVAMWLVSRLFLRLFRRMGDGARPIVLAHAVTFALAVVAGAYGLAGPGELPRFGSSAATYVLPGVLWLVVDLIALRGRQATGREVNTG